MRAKQVKVEELMAFIWIEACPTWQTYIEFDVSRSTFCLFSTVYHNCILYCLSITFYMMVFEVENNPLLHSLVEKNPQKCENLTEVEEFPPSPLISVPRTTG